MKLQTSLISFAAVLLSTVVASSASAQAPFKVNDVTVNGDGCKKGTFTTRVRNGGDQEVTIRFRDFEVTGSPAIVMPNGQRRADTNFDTCEIRAAVTIPAGFQLVFVDSTVSGRVDVQGRRDTDLGQNNVARVTRRYQIVGGDSAIKETTLVNSDGNYSISDDFAFLTSACRGGTTVLAGVTLNLAVAGRNNYANVRLFEEEGDAIRFGFRLRSCDDPTIIPIGNSETVSNACVLKGTRRICYDRNGDQISNVPD